MKKIFSFLAIAAVAVLGLASCSSDDDVVKTPLTAPTLNAGATTVSSLAFTWSAVDGATQYAYELYNPAGTVVLGGVTETTSVLATGLDDNTTYTLKVWAYAAVKGDKGTSPIAEITATTNQIVPLANPNPTTDGGEGSITITWPEVEHAASYAYSYLTLAGDTVTGSTTKNSVTLRGLDTGDYTFYVTAVSGEEAYSNSEPIAVQFHFENKYEIWRQTGKYYSASLNQYFDADIVAYNDGSYTIVGPYGDKDYSISFTVKEGSTEIEPTNAAGSNGGYYYLYVNSQWDYLYAYFASGYSSFEAGSGKDKGEVWFGNYLYSYAGTAYGEWGYDDFTWGSDEPAGPTVDDITGSYSGALGGYVFYSDWVDQSGTTASVTITKVDDNTVTISNFYDWGEDVTATVDLSAKTLTIQPVTWGTWYTLAADASADTPVVGTIADDGTISFSGFNAWYGGSAFLSSATFVLTKQ